MPRAQKPLYIGTNRHVAALDPQTGEELWRTKLPRGGGGHPVTIVIKEQWLYVGCYGHVYGLDKRTGDVLWQNGLPGMGYHAVLQAMEGATGASSPDAVIEAQRRRQQQQAAAGAAAAGA